jgi:hypothetical protein
VSIYLTKTLKGSQQPPAHPAVLVEIADGPHTLELNLCPWFLEREQVERPLLIVSVQDLRRGGTFDTYLRCDGERDTPGVRREQALGHLRQQRVQRQLLRFRAAGHQVAAIADRSRAGEAALLAPVCVRLQCCELLHEGVHVLRRREALDRHHAVAPQVVQDGGAGRSGAIQARDGGAAAPRVAASSRSRSSSACAAATACSALLSRDASDIGRRRYYWTLPAAVLTAASRQLPPPHGSHENWCGPGECKGQ